MFNPRQQRQPAETVQSSTSEATAPYIAAVYGEQVAREFPLIQSVLLRVAKELSAEINEGDFDGFCRNRQAKLILHASLTGDEYFEPMRLLNMLTEGCLKFLEKAISAGENSAEKEGADVSSMGENIERAQKIIAYQKVTLDHSVKGGVTRTLGDLYEFSIRHLISAKAERDVTKVAEVRGIIKKIYEGNLEVEIQQDAEKFIKARASAKQGRSDSCAF